MKKKNNWRNWFKYFQYEEDRDPPTEARNVLLVVATLIAAVTFQAAGVNPPSGVWQGHSHARRFPFDQFEIFVAMASMILTYGSAIFAVTSKESVRFSLYFSGCGCAFCNEVFDSEVQEDSE
uniref:PGG domain-containing protein n=1 Tax=Quercus lobata TaxID=97700 RepID=A0A7N2R2V1_QUELO